MIIHRINGRTADSLVDVDRATCALQMISIDSIGHVDNVDATTGIVREGPVERRRRTPASAAELSIEPHDVSRTLFLHRSPVFYA